MPVLEQPSKPTIEPRSRVPRLNYVPMFIWTGFSRSLPHSWEPTCGAICPSLAWPRC